MESLYRRASSPYSHYLDTLISLFPTELSCVRYSLQWQDYPNVRSSAGLWNSFIFLFTLSGFWVAELWLLKISGTFLVPTCFVKMIYIRKKKTVLFKHTLFESSFSTLYNNCLFCFVVDSPRMLQFFSLLHTDPGL